MEIEKGSWPFCVGGITHDDAKYNIKFTKSGQNNVWLCEECFEELVSAILEYVNSETP